MARACVLVIDDEPNILSSMRRALELEGFEVELADGGASGLEKLNESDVDAVLLDVSMPDMDGIEVLSRLRSSRPELPVIMMSGHASIDMAVQATKHGAFDFCEKPLSTDKLLITLQNCLSHAHLKKEHARLSTQEGSRKSMLGSSKAMGEIWHAIDKAAPTNGRVLILGENGTGKELVARELHQRSKRASQPFIKLNCAAIPSELIESELFGHEKGAFTGATSQRRGKFELADQGTLFLDEIGDMTLGAQAKVLRVLQEGELERVGGHQTRKVNVRVLAATNQDLLARISTGKFREDLYYRLNVVPITLPPLRERLQDLPTLVAAFLKDACEQNDRKPQILDPEGLKLMSTYDWPGNVRELRNFIERLVIFAGDSGVISPSEVASALPTGGQRSGRGDRALSTTLESHHYKVGRPLKEMVSSLERALIIRSLGDHDHHVSNTALALGIERSHLYKKMKAYAVDPKSKSP